MKRFSQFNIQTTDKGFIGDKIKISRVLNREIVVHHYKLEASKVFTDRGTCKCLHLQISINDEKHVLFTSSSGLISAIVQVPEEDFPFATVIMEENERFKFT